MNSRRSAAPDPLVERIQKVETLVRDLRTESGRLRAERDRLGSELERLQADATCLEQDLEATRRRLEALEGDRGTVYGRVHRLLESLGG